MKMTMPGVGLGIIVENADGKILMGRRIGSHAQKWSIIGGRLELGETFEEGAAREAWEEVGIKLIDPKVVAITNNLETFKEEGVHYISVILLAKKFEGEPQNLEPEKCAELGWYDPRDLPQPHFDASRLGVECYLNGVPFLGIS